MQNGITMLNQLPGSNEIQNQTQNLPLIQPNNNQNINITKNEIISENNNSIPNPNNNNYNLDNQHNIKQYNEMIGQLQNATQNGNISLPTRDIPINPNKIVQDETTKPNYIPNTQPSYISNMETPADLINQNNKNIAIQDNMEHLYNEIQLPIIVVLLYFIFGMPIFNVTLTRIFPKLFKQDGNPNLYGSILLSALFGITFYLITKILTYLQ